MSRRTFDRRFRSLTGSAPLQWLITQRVLQAQRLLETSDYSVDEVAGRCGFRSPVALRGHFRRQLGSSPAAYRAAYRARRPQGERPAEAEGAPSPVAGPGGPQPMAPDQPPQLPLQSRRAAAANALGAAASVSAPAPEHGHGHGPGTGRHAQEMYYAGSGRAGVPGSRGAP
jgi:hypothetical protein